jgi:hypothetical protein
VLLVFLYLIAAYASVRQHVIIICQCQQNIILSEAMLTYFKHAIVVISIENKTDISSPKTIEYTRQL